MPRPSSDRLFLTFGLGAALLATAPGAARAAEPPALPLEQLAPAEPNGEPLDYRRDVDVYAFATPRQWFGPWDPATWFPQWGCQVPQYWQCTDPTWQQSQCGQIDAWVRTDYPGGSPCEWVMGHSVASWTSYLPETLVARLDGSLFAAVDYSLMQRWYGYIYEGLGTSYSDELALLHIEGKATTGPVYGLSAPKSVRRGEWEGNGAAVNSCREYVWEKWYDWSKFEDATGGVDGDFGRFVYDRAVHPTNGLVDKVIRSRGGAPQKKVRFPSERLPKNAYFLFQPTPFDKVAFAPSLIPAPSGRAVHTASWAWHQTMNAALAGTPDATLAHEHARQVAFKRLLDRRARLLAALVEESGGMVFTPSPTLETLAPFAATAIGTISTAAVALPTWATSPVISSMTSGAPVEAVADPLYGVGTPVFTGGYTGKMAQLYLVDLHILKYLEHARDVGCLAPTGVSICDWSPTLMAEHLRGQFASERETDLRACLDATADDFAPAAPIHDPVAYGMPAMAGLDYARDSEAVRAFIAVYELYVRDYLDFSPEPGSVTEPAIGWWAYDKKKLGTDQWNMSYEYKLGYGLLKNSGAKAGLCDTDLRVQGLAQGTAVLAGKPIKVIDADNYMVSKDGIFEIHGHLKVMGKALYDTPVYDSEPNFEPLNYRLTASPSVHATVWIVWVPVTIEAGVSGEAGLKVRFAASLRRECPGAGPATLALNGSAHLAPYVRASGFGSVGVGVPGFQAKLQVELDLLTLDAPFDLTAKLAPTTLGNLSTLRLDATATFDLTLSTLSGRVLGVLENPIKTLQETFLSWPGIPVTKLVGWNKSWRIPVGRVLGKI